MCIRFTEIELVKDEEALQRYLDSIKATHTQKKMSQTETKETNKIPKSSFENGIFSLKFFDSNV
jgi:hypothetical protein